LGLSALRADEELRVCGDATDLPQLFIMGKMKTAFPAHSIIDFMVIIPRYQHLLSSSCVVAFSAARRSLSFRERIGRG
jgi:hypothetical protein